VRLSILFLALAGLTSAAGLAGSAPAANPLLLFSTTHLEFSMPAPSTGSLSKSFTITSAGATAVSFTMVIPRQSWFTVSTTAYQTPAEVTVTIPKLNFPPAMLGDVLTITPTSVSAAGIVFPITLQYGLVPNSPGFDVTPTSQAWTYIQTGALPAATLLKLSTTLIGAYTANTVSDGNWLTIDGAYSASSSSLPATPSLACQCAALAPGNYFGTVNILMSGYTPPSATVDAYHVYHLTVALTVNPAPSGTPLAAPAQLTFDYQPGGTLPAAQTLSVTMDTGIALGFTAAAVTDSGNWLAVTPLSATAPASLSVTVNPAGLGAGSYLGRVILTPSNGAVSTVAVTLTVRATAPLAVSPSSLVFSLRQGDTSPAQPVQVSGGGTTPTFAVLVPAGNDWLRIVPLIGTAPGTISISVIATKLTPGTYTATLTVTGTGTAKGEPTITVSAVVGAAWPAVLSIRHAASYLESGIAPGEIVTLFGSNMGPEALAGMALDSDGNVARTLAGVQVLFDGVAAPLIYARADQIAAVAPYEVAVRRDTSVQVTWNGRTSNVISSPVATTAPGVFTANASGQGPAAASNQDGSANSPAHPASRGDTVVLYVTGEGQTTPAGVTGKVTTVASAPPLTPGPVARVSVRIGSTEAEVSFAGEAPGSVSGVMQLNVIIPPTVDPGELPVVVSAGGIASQSGVTVSVK
jgi:uncharacterized protein (TIGR03437 family)